MTRDQLRDPNFAKNAIETAVIAWEPALFALPPPVPLQEEVTVDNELEMVPYRPSIASSPSLRDLGKSVMKRVVEIVAAFVPGGTYSGDSGEGSSSSKKQKK